MSEEVEFESDLAELNPSVLKRNDRPGEPSVFACPECGGTLWEYNEGDLLRFRCRVGNAYSSHTLLAHQSEALEEAFWVALRALEESAALSHRLAQRAREHGNTRTAANFEEKEKSAKSHADIVRNFLLNSNINQNTDVEAGSAG